MHRFALPRRLAAAAAGALLCAGATLATVPASAHDSLVSSDPADGATIDAATDGLALTYSAEILPQGAAASVTDAAGTEHAAGEPAVEGTTVTVPLSDLDPGEYTVTWRVVSSDGHPIDGTQTFTVAGDAPAATSPTASGAPGSAQPSAAPTSEAAPTSDAAAPTEPADAAAGDGDEAGDEAAQDTEDDSFSPLMWVLLIGAMFAIVFGGTWFARRRPNEPGDRAPDDDAGTRRDDEPGGMHDHR